MQKEVLGRIIPKPIPTVPGWLNVLFYLALILLVMAAAAVFLLKNQALSLEQEMDNLENQLAVLDEKLQQGDIKDILVMAEKIESFKQLFKEHKLVSQVFPLLESLCHSKARFNKLFVDTANQAVSLEASTESFGALGQQVSIFKRASEIRDFQLANISFGSQGEIEFSLSFNLAKDFFLQKQE